MKKRFTGVFVLAALGIAIPLALSRCAGHDGASATGHGATRVYEIKPNGDARPASGGDTRLADRAGGGASQSGRKRGTRDNGPDLPEAISPDSVPRARRPSAAHSGQFTTPPVHGGQQASASSPASKTAASSPPASHRGAKHAAGPSRPGSRGSAAAAANAEAGGGSLKHGGAPQSGWAVQVASFGKADNAKRLASRLKGRFKAYYRPGQVKGKTYYRVLVGPFGQKTAARGAAARLRQQGRKPLVRHLP